jgi:hypothetical protein
LSKALSTEIDPLAISDLAGPQSAQSVLANKRGLSASLPEVLGAVGISIAVLAGAAFGIGYGVNYSQDAKAKSVLDSVKSAQVSYQGKNDTFGTLAQLTTGDTPPLTDTPDHFAIAASATNYCAVIKSGSMSGPTFWITAKSGKILETAPAAGAAGDVTCPAVP